MTLCPLKKDKEYELSLWLWTGDVPFTHLEVVLSQTDPTRKPSVIGEIIPSFTLSKSNVIEKDINGWMLVRKKFKVDEEKRFFLIGNVRQPDHYSRGLEKKLKAGGGSIIFLMDDISLLPTDTTARMCDSYAYTQSILYEEHHRHTRHVYLDSLPANSIPLQSSHDTLAGREQSPPLFLPPVTDTLLIPGILFATNSSAINKNYTRLLDSLVSRISNKPPAKMEIDGHTDNTATDEFNQQLSLQRASSIRDYIIRKLPNLEPLTTIQGYGSTRPVATNATAEGKARNRRVEIVLIY
jgi:outer membrane protein OmpA-like peptidoglycan-associated protein